MLVISAEIWPGGDESRAYVVGEIFAANESNLAPISSYSVTVRQEESAALGIAGFENRFMLHDHDRRSSVWALVAAALQQAFIQEQNDQSG